MMEENDMLGFIFEFNKCKFHDTDGVYNRIIFV